MFPKGRSKRKMWTGKNKSARGTVRYGTVRYGTVWYGMVRYSMILETCELVTGTIDHTVMGVIMIMIMIMIVET
jgi:hypothetical protein